MATVAQIEARIAKLDAEKAEARKALRAARAKERRDEARRKAEAERAEALALYEWSKAQTVTVGDRSMTVLDWYRQGLVPTGVGRGAAAFSEDAAAF